MSKPEATAPRPTIGRIVHFHFDGRRGLETRAAIVTSTWDGTPHEVEQRAGLTGFFAGADHDARSDLAELPINLDAVPYADGPTSGAWTWPPRV